MAGWQTHKRIFATQKIKQALQLVLCEIAYSMSIHSSQCTFHGFIKDILQKRNVPSCELHEWYRTYRGHLYSQQFRTEHMRTEQNREKLVSNRTDSSVSVDEQQIKESQGGWQRSLPLTDLSWKIEGPLLAGYCLCDKAQNSPLQAVVELCYLLACCRAL